MCGIGASALNTVCMRSASETEELRVYGGPVAKPGQTPETVGGGGGGACGRTGGKRNVVRICLLPLFWGVFFFFTFLPSPVFPLSNSSPLPFFSFV